MSDSRRGDSEPEEYVFDYMMDDWSMRKPSGVEERKERMIADERAAHEGAVEPKATTRGAI